MRRGLNAGECFTRMRLNLIKQYRACLLISMSDRMSAPRFSDDIHACASAVFEHVGIRNWLHVPAGAIVFSQSKIYGISRVFSTNINFCARKTSIKIEIYGKSRKKMRTASFSCLTVCRTGDKNVCGCRIRPPRHQAGQYSLRQRRPETCDIGLISPLTATTTHLAGTIEFLPTEAADCGAR